MQQNNDKKYSEPARRKSNTKTRQIIPLELRANTVELADRWLKQKLRDRVREKYEWLRCYASSQVSQDAGE